MKNERKETHRAGAETNAQSKYDDKTFKDIVYDALDNVQQKFSLCFPEPWELRVKLLKNKNGKITKQKITWTELCDSLLARDCLKYVPEYSKLNKKYPNNGFDPDGAMIYLLNRETKEIIPLFCGEIKSQVANANALERVDNNARHFGALCYGLPIYPYLVFFHNEAFQEMTAGIWKGTILGGGPKNTINSDNTGIYGENLNQATIYVTGEEEIDTTYAQDKVEEVLMYSIHFYSEHPYNGALLINIKDNTEQYGNI